MRDRVIAMTRPGLVPRVSLATLTLLCLLLGRLLAVTAQTPHRATLEAERDQFAVRHALYGRSWPRDALDSNSVRSTHLGEALARRRRHPLDRRETPSASAGGWPRGSWCRPPTSAGFGAWPGED